jgi:hypothetical protein
VRAAGGRGQAHVAMLIEPPWPDGNDVGLHRIEHHPVIGKRLRRLQASRRGNKSLFIRISNGDDLALRNFQPNRVDAVTIVAFACVSNDCDAIGLHGFT